MKKLLSSFALIAASGSVFASNPVMDAQSCPKPAYPKASLMNEEQGTVSILFVVSAEGKVIESKVEKSSGHKNLDRAAVSGLSQCKFKPAMKDGKAEQGSTKVDFTWTLD